MKEFIEKQMQEEKEFEKIKVTELETIVELVDDKPYYSIRYFDIADMCWHIGYSSYDLKNVVEWKNECFEAVGANDGWIPCSERLPEIGTCVIVAIDPGHVCDDVLIYDYTHSNAKEPCFHRWDDEMWECYTPKVIAWQPLPDPYIEK